MGKRLFVGNLPYDADEDSIRAAFAVGGGTVERVHIPLDRDTQRPRGFAFVDMASDVEAQAALAAMNGASMGTRTLSVSEAEDGRSSRPREGARDRPRDGVRDRPRDAPRDGPRDAPRDAPRDGTRADRESSEAGRGSRPHRFGPDSKPLRERGRERDRDSERRGSKRSPGDNESDFHGRRGNQRFGDGDSDDDDDD